MPPNMSVSTATPSPVSDPLDRLDDVLAPLFDVVVGTNGDRLDLLLGADDMFKRGSEFDGKPAMGNQNEANHQRTPRGRGFLVAPHERAPMMTIRRPLARAFEPLWRQCCVAVNGGTAWPSCSLPAKPALFIAPVGM